MVVNNQLNLKENLSNTPKQSDPHHIMSNLSSNNRITTQNSVSSNNGDQSYDPSSSTKTAWKAKTREFSTENSHEKFSSNDTENVCSFATNAADRTDDVDLQEFSDSKIGPQFESKNNWHGNKRPYTLAARKWFPG